jgi:uncharacterized protein
MIFPFAALILGLLGSLHCIGMCGPIALAIVPGGRSFMRILLYNLGRATTYAALGALSGLAGCTVAWFGGQQTLSIVAGSIVLFVLAAGFFGRRLKISFLEKAFTAIRTRFGKLVNQRRMLFSIGMMNGLLPCGLVYAGLAGAGASGSAMDGAIFMFIFGIGTMPAMAALSLAGNKLSISFRSKMRNLVPLFVGIMALLLVIRGLGLGIPYLSPSIEHGRAVCCKH